jgi:hypothetical protein
MQIRFIITTLKIVKSLCFHSFTNSSNVEPGSEVGNLLYMQNPSELYRHFRIFVFPLLWKYPRSTTL